MASLVDKYGEYVTYLSLPPADTQLLATKTDDEKALQAEIKQILGDERYKDYLRNSDPRFIAEEKSFAEANALQGNEAAQIYDIRQATQRNLAEINALGLPEADRTAKLARLAELTEIEMRGVLGADLAADYQKGKFGQWLRSLRAGGQRLGTGTRVDLWPAPSK